MGDGMVISAVYGDELRRTPAGRRISRRVMRGIKWQRSRWADAANAGPMRNKPATPGPFARRQDPLLRRRRRSAHGQRGAQRVAPLLFATRSQSPLPASSSPAAPLGPLLPHAAPSASITRSDRRRLPGQGNGTRPAAHDLLCGWCLSQDTGAITLGYYAHFMPEAGSKGRTAIDGLLGERGDRQGGRNSPDSPRRDEG